MINALLFYAKSYNVTTTSINSCLEVILMKSGFRGDHWIITKVHGIRHDYKVLKLATENKKTGGEKITVD